MTAYAERLSQWTLEYFLKPCAIAVCFDIVALLWTFPLQHVIAYPFVFLFFGAIMGSAWFGGMIAGFVAVIFSSILVTFFFIPPVFSWSIAKESESFLTAFIVCAVAIMAVSSSRKRAEAVIREARDRLEEKGPRANCRVGAIQSGNSGKRTPVALADRSHSTADLARGRRRRRQILQSAPDRLPWQAAGIAAGRIFLCNPATGRRAMFRQRWRCAVESGGAFEMETRIRSAKGTYRGFLVRSIPQLGGDGTVVRWYGIHIDIEEQHRAQ